MKAKLFTLMLILVMLLCACAPRVTDVTESKQTEAPATDAPKTEELTAEPTQDADDPSLSFVPRYGIYGIDNDLVELSRAQLSALAEQEAPETLASYPVFIDKYPYDPYGLQFEVTPELIEQEIAYGRSFLENYYSTEGTFEFDHYETAVPHVVWYEDDELSVSVNPWQIAVTLKNGYFEDCSTEALLQLPLVQTAISWRQLQNPEVYDSSVVPNFSASDDEHSIEIFEHRDDPVELLLERSFRSITVSHCDDNGELSVMIQLPCQTETEEHVAAASTEALDAFLAATFPEDTPTDYLTEIYYTDKVETGKYIPCYRIYIPEPDCPNTDGETACSVLWVTTAQIAATDGETSDISVIWPQRVIWPGETEATEHVS